MAALEAMPSAISMASIGRYLPGWVGSRFIRKIVSIVKAPTQRIGGASLVLMASRRGSHSPDLGCKGAGGATSYDK